MIGSAQEATSILSGWDFPPSIVLPLMVWGILYALGVIRMSRTSPAKWRRIIAFASGWVTLAVALLSPLHAASERMLSAHMGQHMLLILVAAPLIVASHPFAPCLWVLPPQMRRATAIWIGQFRFIWRAVTIPLVAFALHNGALLFWHLSGPYDLAAESELIHAVQHVCFFATAILFWWGIAFRFGSRQAGSALIYVALTSVITGAIGMVLTFAPHPLYAWYSVPETPGLSPLEDQQLAGLIMWIPGGLGYLLAALGLAARWLAESERRTVRRESIPDAWVQGGLSQRS
jgi:putative membrane protein